MARAVGGKDLLEQREMRTGGEHLGAELSDAVERQRLAEHS